MVSTPQSKPINLFALCAPNECENAPKINIEKLLLHRFIFVKFKHVYFTTYKRQNNKFTSKNAIVSRSFADLFDL